MRIHSIFQTFQIGFCSFFLILILPVFISAQDLDEKDISAKQTTTNKETSSGVNATDKKSNLEIQLPAKSSKSETNLKPYKIKKTILKEEVDALKTEVTSQKTQMVVLKDLLKKEGLDGSKRPLIIVFKNDIGNKYLIDSVTYKLNGEIIYQYITDENIDVKVEQRKPKSEIETKVVPGPYALEVLVIYRGNDEGTFSYVNDYRITRESKFKLDVKKVAETRIQVQAFESGSLFSEFKDRPQLKISQF